MATNNAKKMAPNMAAPMYSVLQTVYASQFNHGSLCKAVIVKQGGEGMSRTDRRAGQVSYRAHWLRCSNGRVETVVPVAMTRVPISGNMEE